MCIVAHPSEDILNIYQVKVLVINMYNVTLLTKIHSGRYKEGGGGGALLFTKAKFKKRYSKYLKWPF